jgi:glutamine phosphoribosylpyrophosphate amidotransferase
MCGIAGFVIKRPEDKRPIASEKLLSELLAEIDDRGGDATGFVARNPRGDVEWHKASCDARRFIPSRRGMPEGATAALAHTRWATQGHQAFPENNHPIRRGAMYVVHNGIVTNDRELFAAVGREPFGDVDSEAIAAVLSHAGTLAESPETIAALASIGGSAAIAAMDDRDGTVLLARISGSPLCVLETRRMVVWASTERAITFAHTAAIGSLGRARVETIGEGTAIVIRDGRTERFSFTPLPAPVRTYVPTPSTSGSYTPSEGGTRRLATFSNWEWSDDDVVTPIVPTVSYDDTRRRELGDCELCGDATADVWDLWDGADDWELCESCYRSLSADMPASLGRENQ